MPYPGSSSSNGKDTTIKADSEQPPKQGIKRALPLHTYSDKSTGIAATHTEQSGPAKVKTQPALDLHSRANKPSESHSGGTGAAAAGNRIPNTSIADKDIVLVPGGLTAGGLEISFREDDGGWLVVRVRRFT